MSWQRACDLAAGTWNLGSAVMLMMRPRNSLAWLGLSEDFAQLTDHPRLVSRARVVDWAWRASSWLDAIMMMSSMYARH